MLSSLVMSRYPPRPVRITPINKKNTATLVIVFIILTFLDNFNNEPL